MSPWTQGFGEWKHSTGTFLALPCPLDHYFELGRGFSFMKNGAFAFDIAHSSCYAPLMVPIGFFFEGSLP